MRCRESWRARMHGQRCRSLLEMARGGGWRRFGGDELRLDEEGLDLLQIVAQKVDQETRQNMGKRRSPKGGGGITCRRRKR
jgi:hypothetical protein